MTGPEDDGESFAALFEQSVGATRRRTRFAKGERLEVKIVEIGKDTVFADLGAKEEGYFDRADLLDESAQLTVSEGSSISAVVVDVDDGRGQVRLSPVFVRSSPKSATGEPGGIPISRSGPLLVEGARIRGKVTGVERYGVFVQIDGTSGRGGRGLIPTAETATPRGADLKRHFAKDQQVEAKILTIAEDGKIRLSIKALSDDEERAGFEAFKKKSGGEPKEAGGASPRGFGTLGDLLAGGGKKKSKKR